MMSPGEAYHQQVGGLWGEVPVERESPPSTYAVAAVINGEPGAIFRLWGVTLLRGAFIFPGVWLGAKLMGVKDATGWKLVTMSMAASSSISLGLLGLYWIQSKLAPERPAPSLEGR